MKNLFKPNTEKAARVLGVLRIALGSIAATTYFMNKPLASLYIVVAQQVIEVIVTIFSVNLNDKSNEKNN